MTRFSAIGGDLVDAAQANRTVTLTEAERKFGEWSRMALTLRREGDRRRAAVFARDAEDLFRAMRRAEEWRRAAGWASPQDADRVTA